MGYLVGVNKTSNVIPGLTGNLLFSFYRRFKRAECDTFNQGVGLFAKTWRSQFVSSKHPKSSRSQFATLETRSADHFREVTKMIACSRKFRPQNHFVGVNKMVYMFGGGDG